MKPTHIYIFSGVDILRTEATYNKRTVLESDAKAFYLRMDYTPRFLISLSMLYIQEVCADACYLLYIYTLYTFDFESQPVWWIFYV